MRWHQAVCTKLDSHINYSSVVTQAETKQHREPDPEDESEALQKPQVVLSVCLLLEFRGGRLRPADADLRKNMHCSHIEESPS